jgi:Flp pilus assembly protein TadG
MPTAMPATTTGRWRRLLRDDRGSTAVEFAIGAPILISVVVLLLQMSAWGMANLAARSAAARAASLARSTAAATGAARDSATANLGAKCTQVTVSVDTSAFRRGGAITVSLGCTVATRGLIGVGLPGSLTMTASSTSPIDLYRSAA